MSIIMITPLLAGNWKMNGSRASAESLLLQLAQVKLPDAIEMAVFPSYPFLLQAQQILNQTAIAWGAQDVCVEEKGAFTGEVSASMLADFGCRFVIVGHSERRQFYGESNECVACKCQIALAHGLTPIVCVGETLDEKERGLTQNVVGRQLAAVLTKVATDALVKVVLAYEPVWAIGTGLTPSAQEAENVHVFIKQQVAEKNRLVVEKMPVLYGGSLKATNASELFAMPNIDGGLVGGASLDAHEFLDIARQLAQCKFG